MKIYVAGASKEIDRARTIMAALRAMGHDITHDWTLDLESAGKPDHEMAGHELLPYASADLFAVQQASVFLLLHPRPGVDSTGCWVELGHAIRERVVREQCNDPRGPVSIIVSGGRRGIFWTMADHNVPHDAAALALIASGGDLFV